MRERLKIPMPTGVGFPNTASERSRKPALMDYDLHRTQPKGVDMICPSPDHS